MVADAFTVSSTPNGGDLIRRENAVNALAADVDEWGRVEPAGVKETAVGDVIDDHVQKLDLVRAGSSAFQKLIEGVFRGGTINSDQLAQE